MFETANSNIVYCRIVISQYTSFLCICQIFATENRKRPAKASFCGPWGNGWKRCLATAAVVAAATVVVAVTATVVTVAVVDEQQNDDDEQQPTAVGLATEQITQTHNKILLNTYEMLATTTATAVVVAAGGGAAVIAAIALIEDQDDRDDKQ